MTSNSELIVRLRNEANFVKDCFTKFSFQTIAFSAIVFGIIAKYQEENELIALSLIMVMILNIAVSRIGTYKYGTANRNFGYELHLYRTKNIKVDHENGWNSSMRKIGWEEAMRAWRIVQPVVFSHLYYTNWLSPNWLKKGHRRAIEYKWFDLNKIIIEGSEYHSGSYLKTMHFVIHSILVLSIIPMIIMTYQLHTEKIKLFWPSVILNIVIVLLVAHRIIKNRARRKILENGLLSIHSCSIMWQAVVVAHYRALEQTLTENNGACLKDYTKNLSVQALELRNNIADIHIWVTRPMPE
jgi:hypothetical protein